MSEFIFNTLITLHLTTDSEAMTLIGAEMRKGMVAWSLIAKILMDYGNFMLAPLNFSN